jgi:hypothetical protein
MTDGDLTARLARLEKRAMLYLAIAVVGVGLGAAGLYVGLRAPARPTTIVLENEGYKLELSPSGLTAETKDGRNYMSLGVSKAMLDNASLQLMSGNGAGQILLHTSTSRPKADEPPETVSPYASAELKLGDPVGPAPVTLRSEAGGGGLSMQTAGDDWMRIGHGKAGPTIEMEVGGVKREVLSQAVPAAAPAPPPAPAPTP